MTNSTLGGTPHEKGTEQAQKFHALVNIDAFSVQSRCALTSLGTQIFCTQMCP